MSTQKKKGSRSSPKKEDETDESDPPKRALKSPKYLTTVKKFP